MKRFILIISAILFSFAARAQSVTYICRYWFDQNDAQAVTTAFSEGTWQAELDVGTLSKGLHTLHVQAVDTSSVWCPPLSYMFFKSTTGESLLDSVDMSNLTYHCWFDQDHAHQQTGTLANGSFLFDVDGLGKGLHSIHVMLEGSAFTSSQSYMFFNLSDSEPLLDSVDMSNLTYHCWFDQDHAHQQIGTLANGRFLFDVSNLEEGPHSLNVMLEGSALTASQSYIFVKIGQEDPLIEPIDMSHLVYHCWFDQEYENRVVDSVSNGAILLDLDNIDDGLHTVHIMLEGEAVTSVQSYMFVKMSQQNPLIEPIDMSNLTYQCWFDQDYEHCVTAPVSNGIMLLDVDNMSDGLHSVHILLEGEALTSTLTYLFFIKPEQQEFGIAKWQYVLNGDLTHLHTTEFSPLIDTLNIVTLLPVETWPVRSSCFHFHPNGDAPYLNAKNEVSFRFWSNDDRVLLESAFYVDYQVQQDIVANVFERNTTETFTAPRNNQIQWYKLEAMVGDSLAFVADKACTMQLFSPSGEEVYAATTSEAMVFGGCHAWEDGTYYLAVHDVTGNGETVSVTYQYVHKYAVLAYDVHLVGNGGCSTITFQGNGFNSLLDMYLVNAQNDTIQSLDIGHESNTSTTVSLNFYQENLGVYDAVFQFYNETIRINGALEVQEPVDITLTTTVSYPSTFLINTPCTYTYTITNNGNMSAYVVPIYVYIASQTKDGISHLEFGGLDLPSVIDGVDLDSISVTDAAFLKAWAEELAEDHYFIRSRAIDEATGDSIYVRSNFFFMNLAPFESRSLTLRITSDEPISVYITVPNDTVQPLTLVQGRGFWDRYCCVQDKISCWFDLTCNVLDLASTITSCAPETPIAIVTSICSCACGILSSVNSITSELLCGEGHSNSFWGSVWEELKSIGTATSIVASITKCFSSFLPGNSGKIAKLADSFMEKMSIATSPINAASSAITCSSFTEPTPDCPPGKPKGGKSNAVNSLDPNDIHGYLSESGSHYMRQEIQNVQYEIEFENDTTLATAAAHTIIVRDTLDATKFDLNSLAARNVTIGDKRLELNGEQTFARTLDLRPELYVIAQIEQDYDPTTGIVEWTIQSLDPMTMEPTDNPYQGVLPVNYSGNGVGFIDYSINLKEAFADGTEISNRAGIIFDQNDVIMTPTWTNIVDAVKPTSHIEEVTPMVDSLNFVFVSQDNRSGVWYHTLYYRNDSTDQQWQVRKTQIFENSFMLHLEDLLTTEYLVIAVDSAGNREEKEMVAEYIYMASGLHFVTEGNWSTASNWQEGTLPGADDVAFIDASCQLDQDAEVAALAIADGQTFTMQSGKTLTVNGLLFNSSTAGLVIKDGAQLINASGNVAATMEKDIVAYSNSNPDAWYTIASPMNEMPIEGSGFATPEFDLYRFNETNLTNEEWENYKVGLADFTTFENGRGYLFANSNAFSPAFTGTLNASAVSCPLSFTERPNDPLSGFNLIGNPFPHDIYKGVGAAIDNVNLASGYYTLTNEGTWQVHTFEDAIHPGQGILVKATAPTVLTIAKSTATATAETGGAKRETSPLSISVKGENGMDQAFVYIGRGNSMEKMGGFVTQKPSLWFRDNGKDYAIAHMEKACETLELCFSCKQPGDFTLTVDRNETEFEYLQLVDHVTGLTVDLLKQPTYGFHVTGQEPDARFSIRFKVTE